MNSLPWPSKTIREICEKPQYGFTASATAQRTGTHFLRITDLRSGELNWEDVPYCECSRAESEQFKVHSGDLVVARIGATTGKTSLILNPPDAVFASYLIRLRPKESLNPFFFYFFTHSTSYKAWIDGNKGNNLKGGVSASLLTEISVPLPPKEEQRKIATVLWKTQQAAKLEEKLAATARELKVAAMRQIFSRGLRKSESAESPYGDVPANWSVQTLGSCCHVQTGVTKGRKFAPGEGIELPYLRVANVQDGYLDLSEIKQITVRVDEAENYLLRDGDVVLTEGGDFDKLGRGFIWRNEIPRCAHQNHVFAVRPSRKLLSSEFLSYLTQSPYGKTYFLTVAHKTTNLACINSTKLKAFPVLLPSLDEQNEIANALGAIDRKIALHERRGAIFHEFFASLLHRLMTGEARVDKLDINVSEVCA